MDWFPLRRTRLIFEIAQRKASCALQALHVGGHGTNSPMLRVCPDPKDAGKVSKIMVNMTLTTIVRVQSAAKLPAGTTS
jgi:hypothetical protein